MEELINMLERYKTKNNYSTEEMAKLLNLKKATYYSYEKGIRQMPYIVLRDFLALRNENYDAELVKILDELMETKTL